MGGVFADPGPAPASRWVSRSAASCVGVLVAQVPPSKWRSRHFGLRLRALAASYTTEMRDCELVEFSPVAVVAVGASFRKSGSSMRVSDMKV